MIVVGVPNSVKVVAVVFKVYEEPVFGFKLKEVEEVKVAKELAVRVVVPLKLPVTALTVKTLPAAPFKGANVIFPVVAPPMVKP